MWNRSSGKKDDTKDDVSSRRNGDEQRSTSTRNRSSSIVDTNPNKKSSSRGDDRDRGFNPTSTSYSSTSRSPYPGTAPASVASSYATATGKTDDQPYIPPGLERNASLTDQMPKSKSSRGQRDEDYDRDPRTERRRGDSKDDRRDSRDQDDQEREKRGKREKKDRDRARDRGPSRSGNGYEDGIGISRGPADFPDQVGSAGFSQFPGQYDGALPGSTSAAADYPGMSSHVQDQFPGQFPTQSTAPYRPPLATAEGGPGLAAEYYGDAGESVAEQPGYRKHSPSLIIGAEPHLLPASAVANPPPEPSATGGVGAAASFFAGGNFESDAESSYGQQASSTYTAPPSRPDNSHHSSSAPAIPTIGGAVMGTAAGHFVASQATSHQQPPSHTASVEGVPNGYFTSTYQRPTSQAQDSYYSDVSRPLRPIKPSSQESNIPVFAAGAAGAAGLATAAYHQSHHSSSQNGLSMHQSMQQQPTTPMAQRHRHHGPLGAVVDFFKDPDGVAQFEEYSEIIGTCRYCFAPGSSPRDAPRKHYYRKRRSNERLGSTRIDKDSRYYSSENESRRRKDNSWLAGGLAGYGLGKMGETLFNRRNDFDDTYSVKTGRQSSSGRSNKSRRRSRSNERIETGITSDSRIYKKDAHGSAFGGPSTTTYTTRRHSRSRSQDRKSRLTETALGAAVGATVAGATTRRRSRSPKNPKEGAWIRTRRRSREHSPEHRHKSQRKKKKKRGFFSFMNGSSSSSSVDLLHPSSRDKRSSSKNSKVKPKDDHQKAEAALLGLGAAAAALALSDGRQGHKRKGVKELVGVKETKGKHARVSSASEEDEIWESAPEDDAESIESGLAYGTHARRGSRESLSSESSGTDKWGWRWASKKKRRESPPKGSSSDHDITPAVAGAAAAGLASGAIMSSEQHPGNPMDSTSSLPLRHVYPVPTSDPSRFDVGMETSFASSTRPGVIPIQHPQPITPVSQAVYSSQAPYEHSYSTPTGPPVFSQPPFQPRPAAVNARYNRPSFSVPGGFPENDFQLKDTNEDLKLRRRDTSPARFGTDAVASQMTPHRRASTKDDISAVRFDMPEEQEEQDRLERRRKRKEEKQRREAEEQEQMDRDRRASRDGSGQKSDVKARREKSTERSSGKSWAAPAAAGVAGAVIGAAVVEASKSEESREERRERRRKEREREEAEEEEEAKRRRERRRRERDCNEDKPTSHGNQRMPNAVKEVREDMDRQSKPTQKEAWKPTSTHEDYGSFFTLPPELVNKDTNQVKVTSANADADVYLDRSPRTMTVGPRKPRDRSASPVFSPADTNEKLNSSGPFPWQIPRLRLLEPTPPSSRGSTPIIKPKDASDEDIEEPVETPVEESSRKPSASRVTWGDDQTHEYTVITPHYEREEFIESSSDKRSARSQAEALEYWEERECSPDRKKRTNGTASSSAPRTYDEDLEFVATLAASAEDAGFDPSIVIDDPTYRRGDSPPGSNERSMPGGFEDDDESRASRRERKKKDKVNGRNDDAVVQDIISQVEESESRTSKQGPADGLDETEPTRKSKSKKSKKSRKDSESKDEFFETSESAGKTQDSYTRDVYESPTEDTRSAVSSVLDSNGVEDGKKNRRKSKRDSTERDDAASTMSSRSRDENANDSGSKLKDKPKGSIWSRVLGKSTDSSPQKNGTKDVRKEATNEAVDESKRKSKQSKEGRSSRDEADDYDATRKSSESRERSRKQRSSEGSAERDSGRITQDLPAKDQESRRSTKVPEAGSVTRFLIRDSDGEDVDEQQAESFLGERPEPPAPPDIHDVEKEPPGPAVTALPASPPSRHYDEAQQSANPQTPESLPSPNLLPSPTAVPIDFRRRRPSGSPRSLSQTPLSSTEVVADIGPRQKPRPRSTDLRDSKGMRLVKRHNAHQEPAPEETYPVLPSSLPPSHTNSRASSVHDPEEAAPVPIGDLDSTEVSHDQTQERRGLMIDTNEESADADLLDAQQANTTASSLHHATTSQEMPSSLVRRQSPPKPVVEEIPHASSTLRDAVLGAAIGGTAAFALHRAGQHEEPSRQKLSREEDEQFQQGLDDMALEPGAHLQQRATARDISHGEDKRFQPNFEDKVLDVDVDRLPDDQLAFDDDFAPQNTERGRNGKRKASKAEQTKDKASVSDEGPAPSTGTVEAQPLSPEDVRHIQEQDVKDAVGSWYAPAPSKKDKKEKKKGTAEELPSTSDLGRSKELHRDDGEAAEPESVQQTEDLTREMSRDQVVRMLAAASRDVDQDKVVTAQPTMIAEQVPREQVENVITAASQDINQDEHKTSQPTMIADQATRDQIVDTMAAASQAMNQKEDQTTQSTTTAEQAPYKNTLERRQTKSKGENGKKARKSSVLNHDLPSSPIDIGFVDPFTEQRSKDASEIPQLREVSEDAPAYATHELPMPTSTRLLISPEATPLPVDDDLDLLEELPPSPIIEPINQVVIQELKAEPEEPPKETRTHGRFPFSEQPLKQSRDPPTVPVQRTQPEQSDLGDSYAFPSFERGLNGVMAVSRNADTEVDIQKELHLTTIPPPENQNQSEEVPSTVNEPVTDTSLIYEPFADKSFFDRPVAEKPVVDTPLEESQKVEDEWAGSSSKRKGDEVEEQTPLPVNTPGKLEHEPVQDFVNEPVIDVPQEESRTVEDEWAGAGSKKKGKKSKKQKSNTLDIEPQSVESEQAESEPSIRGLPEGPVPLATTTISQDLTTMLKTKNANLTTEPNTDKASIQSADADREMHGPVQKASPSADLSSRLEEEKTGIEHFETADAEIQESKLHDVHDEALGNDTLPILTSSAAAIDTARGVQDILRGDVTSSSTGRQNEAESEPSAIEEPYTDKPFEADEVENADWDLPKKKKKGKKSKKKELLSFDEPDTTESGQFLTPSPEIETQLDPEPIGEAINQSTSKKSKKDKKSKKKSLSRTMSDYQDTDEPEVATIGEPQNTKADANLSETSFPPSTANTVPREPIESTGLIKSTIPGDSNVVSGVDLVQEQEIALPKRKKNKKNSQKSKALVSEDAAAPTPEDELLPESKGLDDNVPDQAKPLEENALETSEQKTEDRSKSNKDKKKSKKAQASSWEDDGAPTRDNEPAFESRGLEDEAAPVREHELVSELKGLGAYTVDQVRPLNDTVLESLEQTAEISPKSKKDIRKAKKSQAFSLESEDASAQSEREIAEEPSQKIEELPRRQVEADLPVITKKPFTAEQEVKPPLQEIVEPVSKDVLSDASRAELSSAPLLGQQASNAQDNTEVRQHEGSGANIDPTFETEEYPTYSLKKSKKDKKKGKKARSSAWDDGLQPESREIFEDSAARGDPHVPSIVPMSQESQDWSRQERLIEAIEPTEVVEPGNSMLDSRSYEERRTEDKLSEEAGRPSILDEAKTEDGFGPVKQGKKSKPFQEGKLLTIEPEEQQPIAGSIDLLLESTPGLTRDREPVSGGRPGNQYTASEHAQTTQGVSSVPIGPELETLNVSIVPETTDFSNIRPGDELWDLAVRKDKEVNHQRNEAQKAQEDNLPTAAVIAHDPKEVSPKTQAIQDVETSHTSTIGLLPSATETDMLELQGQRHEVQRDLEKINPQEVELPQSPETDASDPVAEVELMYAQAEDVHDRHHPIEREREQVEGARTATEDLPSPVTEIEMMYAQGEREREQVEGARTATEDLPSPVTEIEMMYAQGEREHDNEHVHGQTAERPQSPSQDLPTPIVEIHMLDPQEQRQYREEYAKELERQDLNPLPHDSPNVTDDLPTPARTVEVLGTQEQREHNKVYAKGLELQGLERLPSPSPGLPGDLPTPVREVEMLNPQEQREYNQEYARELERLLSPPEEGVSPFTPPNEINIPSVPQPDFGNVMQPPFEEIHRPLARPPSLEDIIEESGSRPGSVPAPSGPPEREADSSPLRSTKNNKKGKKGRKIQQPVIWEDETATPPIEEEIEKVIDPLAGSTAMPGSWETGMSRDPIFLEESIERRAVEQAVYISPTRKSSSYRDSLGEHGAAGDYFGIQPSRGAEGDIPIAQPEEMPRAMSTDLPQDIHDESLDQRPLSEQHDHQHADEYRCREADAVPQRELVKQQDLSTTELTSAEERGHGDLVHAHSKKSKKDKMSKRSLGLLPGDMERNSSVLRQQAEEPEEQSARPDISTIDSSREPRESSLQPSSHYEAEPLPMEREESASEERSKSTKELAPAAGLGIGALAAEGLSRIDSKKDNNKNKNSSTWKDPEEETPRPASPVNREAPLAEDQQPRQVSEQFSNTEQQQSQVTPSRSPSTPASYEPVTTETRDLLQPLGSSNIRDSAIHVSGSSVVSEESPIHRSLRDSGYPETESSPIVGLEPHYQDSPTTRELEELFGREPEHDIKGHGQRRSIAEGITDVATKADPDDNVSRARPEDKRRRSRQRGSGAAYDSDDSNDSGFDIQRRRRRMQAMKEEGREPSPVSSTTKERSSELFGSSPSGRQEHTDRPREQHTSSRREHLHEEPTWSFGPETSPQAPSRDASGETESTHASDQVADPSTYEKLAGVREEPPPSFFGGPFNHDEDITVRSMSPSSDTRGRRRLNTISEEISPLHKKDKQKDKRAISDVGSPEAGVKERRMRSPRADDYEARHKSIADPVSKPSLSKHEDMVDLERSLSRNTDQSSRQSNVSNVPHKHHEDEVRQPSVASVQSDKSIHAIIRTPDQVRSASGHSFRSSGTPPLRRVDRSVSGDLRGANLKSEAKGRAKSSHEDPELDINIPSSSTYDPITDKGKTRADMADVYEGWGDVRGGSPMSPTRPPSMRKRQSMQLLEYETRLDQLVSENRLLQNQKTMAERSLEDHARDHSQQRHAYEEALQEQKMFLAQKDSELNELKGILEEWQSKVTHLTEVNEGLISSRGLYDDHEERYRTLEAEHINLREQHTQLSSGMEDIVRHEVSVALEEKNLELRQLRDELERAKQQVRDLQQQLLASRSSEDFIERDEDYFDSQCQSLCGHVQQWVLRFSKFSDMKACYHPSEIRDEKIVDRVENAILDGTDVDAYLQDRVKRRDVFMSVVMTMIWEFIFTRYLFGMDRDQRQKLKNLEKTLQEVGPMSAVHKWRATTLTLLMKREAFEEQRATDTEAVVHEIYDTLATFLPPPSHFVSQVHDSLRKVISAAVDLSIEMRTQRAEYSMLPPLQPEYDLNGDLARKVYFSALTMNERSGKTTSNEALQEQRAVVRMVLFPLVVKNEDDDEQIVVCPAQVLTAEESKGKGKSVRVTSAQGGRSEASFAGTDVNMEGGMI
ncbi:hypothetical protein N7G274_007543 [Stereocaulon virgatum]|uniref:Involucrin repeat protein n=1 Tax=Stereocaulon virgatum TaxID=373712 RepID=A0ABR4A2F6_9LECA